MSMMENSFNNSLQMIGRSDQRSQGGTRTANNFGPASLNQSLNQSYNGPVQAMMGTASQQPYIPHTSFANQGGPANGQNSQSMLPAIGQSNIAQNSYN